jgi:hypothetical protein
LKKLEKTYPSINPAKFEQFSLAAGANYKPLGSTAGCSSRVALYLYQLLADSIWFG